MPPQGEPVEFEKNAAMMRASFTPWLVLLMIGIASFILGFQDPQLKVIFLKRLIIQRAGVSVSPIPPLMGVVLAFIAFKMLTSANGISINRNRVEIRYLLWKKRMPLSRISSINACLLRGLAGILNRKKKQILVVETTAGKCHVVHLGKEVASDANLFFLKMSRSYLDRERENIQKEHGKFPSAVKKYMIQRDIFIIGGVSAILGAITGYEYAKESFFPSYIQAALFVFVGVFGGYMFYLIFTHILGRRLDLELGCTELRRRLYLEAGEGYKTPAEKLELEVYQHLDFIPKTVGAKGGVIAVVGIVLLAHIFLERGKSWDETVVLLALFMVLVFSGISISLKESETSKNIAHFHRNILIRDKRFKKVYYLRTIDRYSTLFTDTCPKCQNPIKSRIIVDIEEKNYTITCPSCINKIDIELKGSGRKMPKIYADEEDGGIEREEWELDSFKDELIKSIETDGTDEDDSQPEEAK